MNERTSVQPRIAFTHDSPVYRLDGDLVNIDYFTCIVVPVSKLRCSVD